MTDLRLGSHSLSSHGVKVARVHLYDWIILLLLMVIDGLLNSIEPFHRFVGEEMMTDIKFPFHEDTIPFWAVPFFAVLLPLVIFSMYYYFRKDVYDFHHAVLGLLFSVLLNGVITDSIKDIVGRPRPNFFWRCFPDGKALFDKITGDVVCHGNAKVIKEGYKSFPSGHTSWSFAGLSFLSWYLSGKIRAFDRRGHVAKLCIVFFPVLVAAFVGVSRVDDYWHHWTDVFTGALIGSTMAAFCYLQFFPFPHDKDGFIPGSLLLLLPISTLDTLKKIWFRVYRHRQLYWRMGFFIWNVAKACLCYFIPNSTINFYQLLKILFSYTLFKTIFFSNRQGWAPHAYFQMLPDRNGSESPGSSANSPHKHQTDIEVQPVG